MKKCSICGDDILPELISGWDKGHNAEPINEGQCCSMCNDTVVTPQRIMLYFKDKQKREITDEQKEKIGKT